MWLREAFATGCTSAASLDEVHCMPAVGDWSELSSSLRFGIFSIRRNIYVADSERGCATSRKCPSIVCNLGLPIAGILRLSACKILNSIPRTGIRRLGVRTVGPPAIQDRSSSIPTAPSPCARLTLARWRLDAPSARRDTSTSFCAWSPCDASLFTPRIYLFDVRRL
ncbi:hypothetical protein LCGC14_1656670 [marine sediment metagenome]|uniref:Uncharacterized protein n=1 Tax=marine sediment metagenome TaxID=412755 RepID=A0A0F9HVA0_9ZZZZ